MIKTIFSKTVVGSMLVLGIGNSYAVSPGVYEVAERTGDFELTVALDGTFSTTSDFLVSNGLANGVVTDLGNGSVEFSDAEDSLTFRDFGFFFGSNDIQLVNTSLVSSRPAVLNLVLVADAPASLPQIGDVIGGTWNVIYTVPRNRNNPVLTSVIEGFITFNADGTYETDLPPFQSRGQSYVIEGDILKLIRSFRVSADGIPVGVRSSTYDLHLGTVSENSIEVLRTDGGFFRRGSRLFSASFTR